jgi:ectoine hydroxylase-related dioxygenase (phytanoyl-CoA dioxygenase family)
MKNRRMTNRMRTADDKYSGLFLPSDAKDDATSRVLAEIAELRLEENAWELDSLGYTVVRPEQVGAGDLALQLREKLLEFVETDLGFRPALDADNHSAAGMTPIGRGHIQGALIMKDRLIERALMTRSMLALLSYLLGENFMLSSSTAMLKVRAPEKLELHSDQVGQPAPLPPYAQTANATWALTDYSEANGATQFVPGSHKFCRHPTAEEALDPTLGVTVSAPAGSIVIWHGNTWHGAAQRTNPGARLSLIFLFCRWYLMPQHLHRQMVTPEMLTRNPDRFATLMGMRSPYSGAESDGSRVDFTLGQAGQHA